MTPLPPPPSPGRRLLLGAAAAFAAEAATTRPAAARPAAVRYALPARLPPYRHPAATDMDARDASVPLHPVDGAAEAQSGAAAANAAGPTASPPTAAAMAAAAAAQSVASYVPPSWLPPDRHLVMANMNTREAAVLHHAAGGSMVPAELQRGSWLLRDHREGLAVMMDPRLFDILYTVLRSFNSPGPVMATSGYRSPRTNALLAERFPGVARNSMHMSGQAVDFFVPGLDLWDVFRFVGAWGVGGVGYYPASASASGTTSWVHVDTGAPRWWVGGNAYRGRRGAQPEDRGRAAVPAVPG